MHSCIFSLPFISPSEAIFQIYSCICNKFFLHSYPFLLSSNFSSFGVSTFSSLCRFSFLFAFCILWMTKKWRMKIGKSEKRNRGKKKARMIFREKKRFRIFSFFISFASSSHLFVFQMMKNLFLSLTSFFSFFRLLTIFCDLFPQKLGPPMARLKAHPDFQHVCVSNIVSSSMRFYLEWIVKDLPFEK